MVVLGCTHYAFVGAPLQRVFGPAVTLVDSAPAIARRTTQLLEQGRERRDAGDGGLRVLTTGDPGKVAAVVQRLWGRPVVLESVRI
ncbi:MAG: glutamate racemase, partial [Acidobacteria bacterium]